MPVKFVIGCLVWTAVLAAAGLSVFVIERDFARWSLEGREWERRLAEDQRAIRLLRAERSYLLRPDRLEYLARKHLSLVPPAPARRLASATAEDGEKTTEGGEGWGL